MFETPSFKEQLESAVSSTAGDSQMERYENAIVDYLFDLARGNERLLMEAEMTKQASERRGVDTALLSAKVIVKTASLYAQNAGRKILTEADVRAAYQAHFCRVWPFCR